jgi:predicted nuclease of predicted toxin-antitoxin system
MLRLAADENLDGRIVRGLQRALADLDLVRVQDTSLREQVDDSVLEWAEREGRVVVTHDVSTMTAAA